MTTTSLGKAISAMKERIKDGQECIPPDALLSSGSTLLNLACSGNATGAFLPGKYYLLVGDPSAGKTFLSMTCFAEALRHPLYKNFELIYDNIEDGCLLDLERLFNAEVAARVRPPAPGTYSSTVEEFYYHLDDAAKTGKPFIYVLDSMDGLTSDAEEDKFDEKKKAARAGRDVAGSYSTSKPKLNSEGMRKAVKTLRETGSILIILSQTRDNLGFGLSKKTRSGGHSLRFYATIEIWTSR
jgi:hypothetical protein